MCIKQDLRIKEIEQNLLNFGKDEKNKFLNNFIFIIKY